jgi:hypothetical protein
MSLMPPPKMNRRQLDNYLRTHRRKAGLSLFELGMLLAYADEGAVSRHERSKTLPPLLMAISYEVIYQVPISELFPGMREMIELTIEPRLLRFEQELQQKNKKGTQASRVAQKLAWLSERRKIQEI